MVVLHQEDAITHIFLLVGGGWGDEGLSMFSTRQLIDVQIDVRLI